MKRCFYCLILAVTQALSLAAFAEVTTGAAPSPSEPSRLAGTSTIAPEQWVLPSVEASFDNSFQLAYQSYDGGCLPAKDPGNNNLPEADQSFSAHRWPQIIKAIRWARQLATIGTPPRAQALMPQLKAVFASEGVPTELVWIAEVESKFNPRAESASGARGLFQFMPITAERFGLKTDSTDDRGIPEKSARAAAQYLAFLYRRFGSWHLALAGYNAGEGCVGRLLKKYGATTFDEIAAYLPEETQSYVPRVMATVALRENVWLSALPSPAVTPTWN